LNDGIVEGCVHMPLGLLIRIAKKKQIENLRNKNLCTYCGTGYRGNIAADELVKERFNAITLLEDIGSWNLSYFYSFHIG